VISQSSLSALSFSPSGGHRRSPSS
jgi:hypothetical protein